MPISLRIPSEKETIIENEASKTGKTKTRYILDAVDEKLGIAQDREQLIRKFAGWLAHEEAEELRHSVNIFEKIDEEDWN